MSTDVHWAKRRKEPHSQGECGFAIKCVTPLAIEDDSGMVRCVVPCRTWGCPHCGEANRRRLYARAMSGAVGESGRRYLLTFTIRRLSYIPADRAFLVLREAWRCWLQRVRRSGWRGEYLRVVEAHRSGYPHLHVLITSALPPSALTHLWCACIKLACRRLGVEAGWTEQAYPGNVDVSCGKGGSAARATGYALKYLAKGLQHIAARSVLGARRMWGASRRALSPRLRVACNFTVGRVVPVRVRERDDWEKWQTLARVARTLTWNAKTNVYECGAVAQGKLFHVKQTPDGEVVSVEYTPPDGEKDEEANAG